MNLPISLFHDEQNSTFMNKLCCNEVNCLRFHQTHLLCILDTTKSRSISPHIRCRRRPAQPFKSAFKVFPCITVEIEESQPTNTLRNQTTKRRLQLTRARDMKEKCHAPIRFIDISQVLFLNSWQCGGIRRIERGAVTVLHTVVRRLQGCSALPIRCHVGNRCMMQYHSN